MNCPKCGGNCYDNRVENDARLARGEKMRPDYKCKDKACDGCVWRPKEGWGAAAPVAAPARAAAPAPAKQGYSSGGPLPGEEAAAGFSAEGDFTLPTEKLDHIFRVYDVCLGHVLGSVVPKLNKADVGSDPESVAAMTATLLIAAQRAGV